jgi:hypothetical protein
MTATEPRLVPLTTLDRLRRSAGRYAEHVDAAKQEKGRRDGLIVRAIDEGLGYRPTARAANLTGGRVAAIVGEH